MTTLELPSAEWRVANGEFYAWYFVSPPTTVRTIWMSLIRSALTVCGSSASTTKSASLPAAIEPLSDSSREA